MKRLSLVVPILLFCLLVVGCAAERAVQKEPEKVVVQVESSERYDALAYQLKSLEQSVSVLRSEMAILNERLRNIRSRPPLTTYQLPKEVLLCGERIPLEDESVRENLDREFFSILGYEVQVILWMKRGTRYFPHIESRLREMGLPDDLKYVTIIESGLRPDAVSSSGASGIWQFIPATGEKFGMRKNRDIDERFDFYKATEGALVYLKSLYEEFKSWPLSMAAYNAGENRVRKEIAAQGTKDYFHLDLSAETERYVYKIAVAKVILSDPERYGFHLGKEGFYDPLQLERVEIELTKPLPIIDVARALGFFYKEIKEMNPHLSDTAVPPGIHFLNLPPGSTERFRAFFSDWKKGLEAK